MSDAYEICRHVKRYYEKNGYTIKRSELGCSDEFVDQLVANGVIELSPLSESGPLICVHLTEKGARMAAARR